MAIFITIPNSIENVLTGKITKFIRSAYSTKNYQIALDSKYSASDDIFNFVICETCPKLPVKAPVGHPHRSSNQRCSIKKDALKDFAKFTGKHLCKKLFLK